MSIATIIPEIHKAGLKISKVENNLKIEGQTDRISNELVQKLKEHKAELLGFYDSLTKQFPLTELQKAYFFGRQGLVEIGDVSNQIYHEIKGCWNIDQLQESLTQIAKLHSALRLVVIDENRQAESNILPLIRIDDISELSADKQSDLLREKRNQKSHYVAPIEGALIDVEVTILEEENMILHVNHDGMIMDGISMFLFFKYWSDHYYGKDEPVPSMPFSEHIKAQDQQSNDGMVKRSQRYWLERAERFPGAPELPLAKAPEKMEKSIFRQHEIRIDSNKWVKIKRSIATHGLTESAVIMTAYAEVLARWGAGNNFALNTTVSDRKPIHPQAFNAIGQFSTTVLVEILFEKDEQFLYRAKKLQAQLMSDLDNRHFSGIDFANALNVQSKGSRVKMPYTFNSTLGAIGNIDGSHLNAFGEEIYSISQTPQVYLDVFVMEQLGDLVIRMDGVDDLFYPHFLSSMGDGFEKLLLQLEDVNSWTLTDFDLLPEVQKSVRKETNNTQCTFPDRFIWEDFVQVAQEKPDNLAVITQNASITYGGLLRKASGIAEWLIEQGMQKEELVAVYAMKGIDQIAAILAVVMSGGAYLPLEPTLVNSRQDFILKDARVQLVLTDKEIVPGYNNLLLSTCPESSRILKPKDESTTDDIAYVLYTSGTTGIPKGVMVTHKNVANVLYDCKKRFVISESDRFFGISAFNFDLSVWDIFGSLNAGAALVLPSHDQLHDVHHWVELCEKTKVTVWNSVPAIVSILLDYAEEVPASIRLIMMSGDRIPVDLPNKIYAKGNDISVVSLGGPTETTIWNVVYPVPVDHTFTTSIPYGKPNHNNQAFIRNDFGQDKPDWVPGEILASGMGVTKGYWNDPDRTNEKYFADQLTQTRLYKTGDIGRYLPDGSIEILGRSDFQLKVNGYRVEATEIESLMLNLDAIAQVVIVVKNASQGPSLVAHAVAKDIFLDINQIREYLKEYLPDYMIPSAIKYHDALPLNKNNKVDRGLLGKQEFGDVQLDDKDVLPSNDIESRISSIWAAALSHENVDVSSDFIELGGNSMSAVRLLTDLRKAFGVVIMLDEMYELNTVRKMAKRVETLLA